LGVNFRETSARLAINIHNIFEEIAEKGAY
jgi:hypothetical protein